MRPEGNCQNIATNPAIIIALPFFMAGRLIILTKFTNRIVAAAAGAAAGVATEGNRPATGTDLPGTKKLLPALPPLPRLQYADTGWRAAATIYLLRINKVR